MEKELEATISPANSLDRQDLKKWGMNLIKFVAPTMAIFFGLLAQGMSFKQALPVAILGLYQALSDLFSKYKKQTVTII